MKKFLPILILLILFCALALTAGCSGNEDVTITSISVVSGTLKTEYTVGDTLDLTGAYLLVTYSNGNTERVAITESMVEASKFNTIAPATRKTLYITYQNLSTSFIYSVKAGEIESLILSAKVENAPTAFYQWEEASVSNGVLTSGEVVLTVKEVGEVRLPIKYIWVKNFTTARTGAKSITIAYVSDYGDGEVTWEYEVLPLPGIKEVTFSKNNFSVYQNSAESTLISQLSDVIFTVEYENGSKKEYAYNTNFKTSGFSSQTLGESTLSLTFTDAEGRTVKFSLPFTVKKVYPEYIVTFDENYEGGSSMNVKTEDGLVSEYVGLTRTGYKLLGWYLWNGSSLSNVKYDFSTIITTNIQLKARWQKELYTVTLVDESGKTIGAFTYDVESERSIPRPSQLSSYTTPAGYVFQNYTNEAGDTVEAISKNTTGNIVLTAHFTPVTYAITYRLNDSQESVATHDNPAEYSVEKVVEFTPATRAGYHFDGWRNNGEAIVSTEGTTGALTIEAAWTAEEYSLTRVNPLTDEVIDVIPYHYADPDTYITNYEIPAYLFMGWYRDKDCTETQEFTRNNAGKYYIRNHSSGNLTIYAKLVECYTLALDTQITDGVHDRVLQVVFTDSEEKVTLPIPVRAGRTFTGWTNEPLDLSYTEEEDLEASEEGITLSASALRTLIKDNQLLNNVLELQASYLIRSHVIRHHFYTNEKGEEIIAELEYETSETKYLLTESDQAFVPRNGFSFVNWYMDPNYAGNSLIRIEAETHDEDVDVYAKWSVINYSITLNYNVKDESLLENKETRLTYTAFDSFTVKEPYYPYYEFSGWYADEDLTEAVSPTVKTGSYGNIVWYAKWEPVRYRIIMNNLAPGGVYTGNTTYTLEEETVTLLSATRTGYAFEGWYLDARLTNRIESFSPAAYKRDIEIYAKWSLVEFAIHYHYNDNASFPASSANPETANYENEVVLLPAERNGYLFAGWYYLPATNGVFDERARATSLTKTSEEVDLYADWVMGEYSINYLGCESIDTSSLPTVYTVEGFIVNNRKTKVLPVPTRNHYTHAWQLNGETVTSLGGNDYIYEDITLTAVWTAKQYKFTYSVSGKSGYDYITVEDFENGVYTLPSFDTLVEKNVFASTVLAMGKEVSAWKIGSYEKTEVLVADLKATTVTGVVTSVNYDIEYVMHSGATFVPSTNVKHNPEIYNYNVSFALTNLELEGYVFGGWFLDNAYQNKAGSTSTSNGITITTINLKQTGTVRLYGFLAKERTLSYVGDEGMTLTNRVITYSNAKEVSLGTPTKTNYNFGGWWCPTLSKAVTTTKDFADADESLDITVMPLFYLKSSNGATNTANLRFVIKNGGAQLKEITTSISSKLVIPAEVSGYTVTSIADDAFRGKGVTEVNIKENIQEVGNSAFANCTKLTKVKVEGNAVIRSDTFNDCTLLKTIELSTGAVVNKKAFADCTAVQDVTFDGTSGETTVRLYELFGDTSDSIPSTLKTVRFNGTGSLNGMLYNCSSIQTLYITAEEEVTLTAYDIAVLEGKTVKVKTQTLADAYAATYEGITFQVG